jgi:hypothetical protein
MRKLAGAAGLCLMFLLSPAIPARGQQPFTDIGAGLTGVRDCSLAWGDCDNDGDLDLALAGARNYTTPYDPISKIYRNDAGTFTDIGAGLTGVWWCSLAWGDYDDDGDLDIALAGVDASRAEVGVIYRNDGVVFDTAPTAPTGLSAAVSGSDVTFSCNAATDPETPQPGLTYSLRVGTTSGGNEIMSGMAIVDGGDDGKRLVPALGNCQHNTSWMLCLPPGTYHWSVQAVDGAFAGSPWATEETVTRESGGGGCLPAPQTGAAGPLPLALFALGACSALARRTRCSSVLQ